MIIKSIATALVAGLCVTALSAQEPTAGPRWSAYVGCWEPIPDGQIVQSNARVCVVPTSGGGADLISLTDQKVTERTHVETDDARHPVARQGCAGWESAVWSANGRRLFFTSEQTCGGNLQRKASGLFAVGSDGHWVNVVNVNAGGGQGLRALRYAPVAIDSTYPSEVVAALGDRAMSLATARISARTSITVSEVIEASKSLDPAVVQAWLAAAEQKFRLDAPTLVRLADAGVPPATIDVMVAVSNPTVFAVASSAAGVSATENPAQPMNATPVAPDCYSRMMDPWGYSDYGLCDPYRRYGYYGSRTGYGYDPYDYDYGSVYGYGYGNGYNRNPVVVIVRGSAADPQAQHGRMTKDGYVSARGTTATPTSASTDERSSSGSTKSSGSSSSGSSRGSSSPTRTAHPKPPE